MSIKNYQDLLVWQKAMELAEMCYKITKRFPKDELFGMTSQIRRAGASVPANIAEGWGRGTTREYIQFLRIAQGSIKELETHLILSQRVILLKPELIVPALELTAEVSRMLISLIGSLQRKLK